MLSRVTILVVFVSVVRGNVALEESQDGNRQGKLWDWQKLFNKGDKTPTDVSESYEGGNVTIGPDGGEFFNPKTRERNWGPREFDEPREDVYIQYIATISPPANASQMVINIESLNIIGPTEGACGNDSLVILGGNPGPEIPTLCGVTSNQELYVGIDNSDGPFQIVITLVFSIGGVPVDAPFEWNITVSYRLNTDPALPRRCLQYHTALEGTIESFNFNFDPPGMMLNDQTYSICFGYVIGYCNIAFNFKRFDLGRLDGDCREDYLLIGDDKYCSDKIQFQIIANATGPIDIGVRSDSNNDIEEEGFSATYTMMGC